MKERLPERDVRVWAEMTEEEMEHLIKAVQTDPFLSLEKRRAKDRELLANIKAHMEELEALLSEMNANYEDGIYRFYHQSFKVYWLQHFTIRAAEALRKIAPSETGFCPYFQEILDMGASGKEFEMSHNRDWTTHTRPMVEAFLHAKYFLEVAVRYGRELDEPLDCLPYGWAALLSLYGIR